MANVDLPREEHGLPADCADDLFDDPKFLRWYKRQDPETAEEKIARVRRETAALGVHPVQVPTPRSVGGAGSQREGPGPRPVEGLTPREGYEKEKKRGLAARAVKAPTPRSLG